ncbi:pyridoxal-phosphate-dependent aminotransferase family protein [Capillimicrobium parvum]|uniref:(S)-ureidoglycine--glyoxylate transaminase n=1 Tax=Capillimicrobium parvum TaxID=2884022 RepID=A0A9E6XZR6_9ACTN|nr:aminotransferase class V-fold PLP-dependent enzyme [Capillimicrobium parvum]UGS37331.1 (S)-ureidoglycine--glyoxylate transaminase [Capillimicrobium parvum]
MPTVLAALPVRLDPPPRLLCGPGPSNVAPPVLAAMQRPMLGHLDPGYHGILDDVTAMLRAAFGARDGLAIALQATGSSGMEAALSNLLEPGDTTIVAVNGFFGRRMAAMARRHGAQVVEVEAGWGEAVSNDALLAAHDRHPRARLIGVVHGETSTGVEHPLAELGAALRDRDTDTLLLADCVTTLGGVALDVAEWNVDVAYSCTQKCLGAPPGLSPLVVSERAMARVRARTVPVPFSLDLQLLEAYWVTRPTTYHHTAPVLMVYALHEALRLVLQEGLAERWRRHEDAGAHLRRALAHRGLSLIADPDHQLAPLAAVHVPDGVDGRRVQERMLREHGIEIGGGLGPQAPPMWRIGLMGENATTEIADRVTAALDAVLEREIAPAAA